MVKIAQVQIAFWDKVYKSPIEDYILELNDEVVIKTEWGLELGKVIGLQLVEEAEVAKFGDSLAPIVRKATTEDHENSAELNRQKSAAVDFCKKSVERCNLPMKVIDAHFSFDGSRLIFPFIADGRVDFRVLVKDLTHHFQKSIRLQQIGIRDEAKICGDVGSCGRTLCCRTHLKELVSITSDFADVQQVAHRGSERLSGQCGRLRCCLAFEKNVYEELGKALPAIGTNVRTDKGRGKVIGWHTLKQSVDVLLEGDEKDIIEVPIKGDKK